MRDRPLPRHLVPVRVVALTTLAMIAFAANSLLCRAALAGTAIDAASFTTLRLASGALMLWAVVRWRHGAAPIAGSWWSALALFVYAAAFSYAYLELSAASGALLLFGAVQATMIGYGLARGERVKPLQLVGLTTAGAGLVGLLLPGLTAPAPRGAALMLCAGVAWGVYSLRGRGAGDPTQVTAGNFMRSVPIAVVLSVLTLAQTRLDAAGIGYALASGAVTSGIGYVIWYAALPGLRAATAASVQLSVPVITAFGGIAVLGEALSLRLVLASVAVLGGIALVIFGKRAQGVT